MEDYISEERESDKLETKIFEATVQPIQASTVQNGNLTDIVKGSNLTNVGHLNVSRVSHISAVADLSNVSRVSDIINISNISNVRVSNASNVGNIDISRVSNISNISLADLTNVARVSDILKISNIANINTLRVTDSPNVSNLSDVARISNLSEVARVSNLSEVAMVSNMASMSVANLTSVADFSNFHNPNIKRLSNEASRATDLSNSVTNMLSRVQSVDVAYKSESKPSCVSLEPKSLDSNMTQVARVTDISDELTNISTVTHIDRVPDETSNNITNNDSNFVTTEETVEVANKSEVLPQASCKSDLHQLTSIASIQAMEQTNIVTGEKSFACSQCGKSFHRLSNLRQHLETHIGEKKYGCQQCGKRFLRLSNLRQHLMIHSGEKRFHCHQCGKSFVRSSNLKDHRNALHNGDKQYVKLVSPRSSQTHIHVGIQTMGPDHDTTQDDKKFECQQCGKKFVRSSNLQQHMEIHSDKRYGCPQCGKLFVSMSNLKDHINAIHNGDRPYKCEQCGESFPAINYLKRHMKTHLVKSVDQAVKNALQQHRVGEYYEHVSKPS